MSHSSESPSAAVSGGGNDSGGGEIILFGVRVKVDPMRKSVSMNNLTDYEPINIVNATINKTDEFLKAAATEDGSAASYASADDAVPLPSNGNRERKRGVPWTEEEHKLFLIGLQKVGKGDWRGISRNYVKTRTPTQVASHAQKYFIRRNNLNRRRRRSSLFDITTDSVAPMKIEDARTHQEAPVQPVQVPVLVPPTASMPLPVTPSNINGFSVVPFPVAVSPVLLSMQCGNPNENPSFSQNEKVNNSMSVPPVLVLPKPSSSNMVIDLNLNQQIPTDPLSLRLSLSSGLDQPSTRDSGFSSFKNGESFITVA